LRAVHPRKPCVLCANFRFRILLLCAPMWALR
jgi:hypothetical protein